MVVERAELREVTNGLLQVVSVDLLVLRCSFAVDGVCPLNETFVKRRAGALKDAVVCRVADEDVVEAVGLLFGRTRVIGADELLVGQRRELASHLGF